MNISKMIKIIQKEVYEKKRDDNELNAALREILYQLGMDFSSKSVELKWESITGIFDWSDDERNTHKQRLFNQRQSKNRLERVCKELQKYGFKCKAIANHGKVNGSDQLWFQTPFISVKF